jgi:hypothetical protein
MRPGEKRLEEMIRAAFNARGAGRPSALATSSCDSPFQ